MGFYLHIGLHKTGTSVLQQCLFPFLAGVDYLGKPFADKNILHEALRAESGKVLFSCESTIGMLTESYPETGKGVGYLDNQLRGLRRLSEIMPSAKVIIGIRPHVSWVQSIYKHYLKYGGTLGVREFLPVNSCEGCMSFSDFSFSKRIEFIRDEFDNAPFVYNQVDLKSNPERLVDSICGYLGVNKPSSELRFKTINEGVGIKRAKVLLRLNSSALLAKLNSSALTHKLRLDNFSLSGYLVSRDQPLVFESDIVDLIKERCDEDWQRAHMYSQECLQTYSGIATT